MKKLYSFTIDKIEEIEEQEESQNEAGKKTITINKVNKSVKHKFCLVKPSRNLRDQADLFFGAQYGSAVKSGMIPYALLQKRFEDDNGTVSKKTQEKYEKILADYYEKNKEYNKLLLTEEDKRTEDEKNKVSKLAGEILSIQEELKNFQISQINLFNTTPEVYARNKTVIWYMLHLSYHDKDKLEPFFPGDNYEEKMSKYEEYEDLGDEFFNKVIMEFLYLTAVYFNNNPGNEQEFKNILSELKKQETEDFNPSKELVKLEG